MSIDKYIPKYCYKTIYNVDYNKLYEEGKRIILFDLDNTIVTYDVEIITEDIIEFFDSLKQVGFEVGIVSNNSSKRVKKFINGENIKFSALSLKPFALGYNRILRQMGVEDKKLAISIGDQLMTDVVGSYNAGIDSIYVKTIKKSNQKWYTKINRIRENRIIEKIKRINFEKYKEIVEVNNG